MRVAVTGGSGFIGAHVVDQLKEAGHEVVVIDHRVAPRRHDVRFEDVDILNLSSLIHAFEGMEYVFHLAGVADVYYAFKYPVHTVNANVVGTTNVLEAARLAKVRRVIFASTVWVYDVSRDGDVVTEETPLHIGDVTHIYTSSKIAAEMIMYSYRRLYNTPYTILRYGIPYGPRMREQIVIPIFIRQALDGKKLTITGDGTNFRNWIYIEDLARAHVLALAEKAENQTYNLDGAERITVRQVIETLERVLGTTLEVEYLPARPGDFKGREASSQKALRELGWEPRVGFEEGIRRTVDWFLQKWGYHEKSDESLALSAR